MQTYLHDNIGTSPNIIRIYNLGTGSFIIGIRKIGGRPSSFLNQDAESWFDEFGYSLIQTPTTDYISLDKEWNRWNSMAFVIHPNSLMEANSPLASQPRAFQVGTSLWARPLSTSNKECPLA